MKRSKKAELNINIEFGRLVFSQFLPVGNVEESHAWFHTQEGGTEIIPSRLLIPSRLEKATDKGGIKNVPSRFLSHPDSQKNTP